MRKSYLHMVLFTCLWAVSGCSWLIQPPDDDPKARQMVEGLDQHNGTLTQYKALAQYRLVADGQAHSGTMALAAILPDRMRVELLSMVGQPVTSLVADGHTIRIRPHGKERLYEIRQSPRALERVIYIPLGIEQLQRLLIGRPLLPEFAAAQFAQRTEENVTIEMKNRYHNTRAVLVTSSESPTLQTLEVYDEGGEPQYLVRYIEWQPVGNYRVPKKLAVETRTGHRLTVTMRRFWPDAEVAEDAFELTATP